MFSGIIAGIIGGVVITLASGSQLGVSGPAAGLVVIVLTGIETLGSFEAFLLAVMLAGVIQAGMGFAKAVVASLETLLVSEATDKLDPYKRITPANQELKAQGLGNFVSGLIGGIPITQVIVRSSANIQAGGKTKAASFFHGLFLMVSVLLVPSILNLIPLACLAAILVIVGFKLAKPSLFKEKFKNGWDQFIPFVVTIVAILFTDLLMGVGIGLVVAVFYILRAHYRNAFSYNEQELGDNAHIRLTLAEEVSFLNKAPLMEKLSAISSGTHVEINATRTIHIDHDVLELIQNFKDNAQYKGIELTLLGFDKNGKLKSSVPPKKSLSKTNTDTGLHEANPL
ncbi:UNVERIFIED_CONTAM: hypothetical protein GTU68_024426 [Idotea baltica]|nr:hypothetical protein [Idotea baltica]